MVELFLGDDDELYNSTNRDSILPQQSLHLHIKFKYIIPKLSKTNLNHELA